MSTTVNAPFGLRPAYSPSGVIRPTAFTIASGYGANIFQNQPVRIAPATSGGETEGTIVASAVGAPFIGAFQGVEFTDSDGRRRVSNKWTASQVGTDVVAYVTLDPTIVYEIQANGSIAVSDMIASSMRSLSRVVSRSPISMRINCVAARWGRQRLSLLLFPRFVLL